MKAQFLADIISVTTDCQYTDGIDITAIDTPIDRMRLVDNVIVDAGDYDQFFIDSGGQKHLVNIDNALQRLSCNFTDELSLVSGVWVIRDSMLKKRETMSMRNAAARLRLINLGLFDTVDELIMAMPRNNPLYVLWEYGDSFHRTDPSLIDFCKSTLGMTELQIDDLFLAS